MVEIWKLYKDSRFYVTKNGVLKRTAKGGIWEVSSFGRIRKNGEIVELKPLNSGYLACPLRLVHRIVAEAFIPNPDNKPYVDHIDTNIYNNRVDNLRWVTASENNMNNITRSKRLGQKRTSEQKRNIAEGTRKAEIGRKWYNDGIKDYFIYPENALKTYKEGRMYHKRRTKNK